MKKKPLTTNNDKQCVNKIKKFLLLSLINLQVSVSYADVYQAEIGRFQALNVTDNWSTNITPNYDSVAVGSSVFGFFSALSGGKECGFSGDWYNYSYKVSSLDGYSGIEVASGVLLVPMNLNVVGSGRLYYAYDGNLKDTFRDFNTPVSSNDKGVRNNVGSFSNPTNWCSLLYNNSVNEGYFRTKNSQPFKSKGSVSWGVYVSPVAKSGNYSIPDIYIGQTLNSNDEQQIVPSSLRGSSIKVKKPFSCQINPPATIDFGKVNITGKRASELLASQSKDIGISCTMGDDNETTDVTVTFMGDFSGDNWGRLNIFNSSNQVMGYIRGRYLKDAGGRCTADVANEVGFNDYSGSKKIRVKNGITYLPITWSLCMGSPRLGLLGTGSAKATMFINWE